MGGFPPPPPLRCLLWAQELHRWLMTFFLSENPSDCEHSGAEEVTDGLGHLHEDGRLLLHGHLLRSPLQRGNRAAVLHGTWFLPCLWYRGETVLEAVSLGCSAWVVFSGWLDSAMAQICQFSRSSSSSATILHPHSATETGGSLSLPLRCTTSILRL